MGHFIQHSFRSWYRGSDVGGQRQLPQLDMFRWAWRMPTIIGNLNLGFGRLDTYQAVQACHLLH